jgi:hypothetical protein
MQAVELDPIGQRFGEAVVDAGFEVGEQRIGAADE